MLREIPKKIVTHILALWLGRRTGAQVFNRTYTYDALNRLTNMTDSASNQNCKGLHEALDAWGNRLSQSVTSGSCFTFSAAATTQNRLSGYSYDAAGNMTNDGSHTYYYDEENRLMQVDGTPISVTAPWPGTSVPYPASRSTASACYIYDAVTADHLGSTRLMTNMSGGIYDSMDYDPFGKQIAGGGGTTHKFTGKERDPESGLDMFGARYYASTMGRFVTPDMDESAEALPYSDLDDPQTLNLYGYVRNNPLSLIDPDGHMQCTPKPGDPSTIVCEPDSDPPNPPEDPCGSLCQQVFHSMQSQRTWDLSARVTNKYIATPLLTFLSLAVPGALEAAGPTMETSLGTAIVSGTTKAAAKQAVEDATMTAAQKAAVKRAVARATRKETVSVERLTDGSIRVLKSRPGFDGNQVVSTIVKESGQSSTVQLGVRATGEVMHYDPK